MLLRRAVLRLVLPLQLGEQPALVGNLLLRQRPLALRLERRNALR